jgi:hypothetical protein
MSSFAGGGFQASLLPVFTSSLSPFRARRGFCSSLTCFGGGFSPPNPLRVWRFVWIFSFSLVLAGKHSREVSEGESPPLVLLVKGLGRASVFFNL